MSMDELIGAEEQIKQGFVQEALGFKAIADDGLYKSAGYKSFDTYCDERANCGARHGWRMVKAGGIVQQLLAAPVGQLWLPANERQAREFARVKPRRDSHKEPDVAAAAQIVYDYAPKKNGEPVITAESIRETLTQQKIITPPRQKNDKDKREAERRRKGRALQAAFRAVHELKAEMSAKQAVREFGDDIFTSAYEGAVAYLMELEELRNAD